MARLKEYIEGPVPSYMLEDVPDPYRAQAPSYTLEDFAEGPTPDAVAKIAKRSSEMRLDSPIPTASAPPTRDAAAPVVSTQPAVTSTSPAGKPESMGTPSLPAPQTEPDMRLIPTQDLQAASRGEGASALAIEELARRGGGGVTKPPIPEGAGSDADEERNLYLARLIARNAASFGAMGAGKSIDTGAVKALGERLKQVQALRAKREEQALEQQRERATWGTSNRATLASFMAQYKDRPEVVEALKAQEPGADTTKPSDFLKNLVGSLMTPPKVEKAVAEIPLTKAKVKTEEVKPEIARGGLEVKRGTLAERERSNKANEEIRRNALLAKKLSDTKAADEVRAAGSDPKAAERAITRAMETAESDKLGIAGNIRDFQGLEKVAPGFTQGKVPSWLGQGSIEAARKVPALSKQASELASALETFIAGIRKSLFGASLTGNEKESFDAIVSGGLLMPPDVLAANINRLREGAAKFAQNHFTVAQTLYPELTGRVLGASTLFGPAVAKGGIYSDVWKLPAGPAVGPSESQIAKLRANPDRASDFDAKFGPGAAAKILGGQ